jgi:hypothetical protein
MVVAVASSPRKTTRIVTFDPSAITAPPVSSADLPVMTSEVVTADGPYECGLPVPTSPLVAGDGTILAFSDIDDAIVALDGSLTIKAGWPYRPATPLVRRDPGENLNGIACPWIAVPAVGPDTTLYLPLQARDASVGGSIAAVGADGRARPGWPVELRRAGSEFWSIGVGLDGIVYALAIEPESGRGSSASILALARDSTVLWTTTIVDA